MTADGFIAALDLPGNARVDQRVPKKLLVENGASTASDRRQINDGIEEVQWLAALKPNTIGVPLYRDETREYLEIAVLNVKLRGKPNTGRLAELIHRAVPYPLILLLEAEHALLISLAHKRRAQNELDKFVLDGEMVEVVFPTDALPLSVEPAFARRLALARQPQANMHALYQGWIITLEALLAAQQTGVFETVEDPRRAVMRRQALAECQRLKAEVARLRALASKERQISRQVEINLSLKKVEARLNEARKLL